MDECEKKTGGNRKTLKGLRIDAGMKQAEIADLLGVNKYTVSAWERGIQTPNWNHLALLARILNTSIADLVHILGMDENQSETDMHLQDQQMHLAARGQVSIVSEILYLFTLLDEQGRKTVRMGFELLGKGEDDHDYAERTTGTSDTETEA